MTATAATRLPAVRRGTLVAPGYRVLGRIHRSNVFDVFDAWSEARHCRCVVKTLRPDRLDDRGAARRLLAEGRRLRRYTHPHIVRAWEVHAAPRPLVVLETLSGETLAHLIESAPRPLPAADAAWLGLHLASALRYLHADGLLHLDLKPSNVVAAGGRAVLIDLSVAQRPGRVPPGRGTWCYMAPEQARGGVVGPPADVWGLGMVLWEALAGEPALDDPDTETPQLHAPVPPLRTRRRLPAPLAALIDGCLAPDAADRPTLERVAARLAAVAGADPRTV